mmetsp:Transcript_38132/g.89384  ORF Transcript_38132/g.89384 Transcript_38132/m.89384 type:complete len:1013 (-) Transcript_38132:23-3061(-)
MAPRADGVSTSKAKGEGKELPPLVEQDRARRLREALPRVEEAVQSERVFSMDHPGIWNDLRRGVTDLQKDPGQLESLQVENQAARIDDVWEFILSLMSNSVKYARQILDITAILLSSTTWAEGFLRAKNKRRLALWKLSVRAGAENSPVDLTLSLLRFGVSAEDLLPATETIGNSSLFMEELLTRSCELGDKERKRLQDCSLTQAWHVFQAKPASQLLSENGTNGSLADDTLRRLSGDLSELTRANEAQAETIAAQGGSSSSRPGSKKDVVENLLSVTGEALEVAAGCLRPILVGYEGEPNIALTAKAKVLDFRRRLMDLTAELVVIGPCQAGKTSLMYALAGFASIPPSCPSMVITKWVHSPNLAVPCLSIPEALATLLRTWASQVETSGHWPGRGWASIKPKPWEEGVVVEGIVAVAEALECIHQVIHLGRINSLIPRQALQRLAKPGMNIVVEVAFQALENLEESLTDVGTFSMTDLPSPDTDLLWDMQDISTLMRRSLQEADGVLVVVDSARYEVPRWFLDMLRDACAQDRRVRRDDVWIVANRIDQIPEFYCKDGMTDVIAMVKDKLWKNYSDIVLSPDRVIPAASRLSLLALCGVRQVASASLSPEELHRLAGEAWFAQVCAFLFGVHWYRKVRTMDKGAWKKSMEELQLLGQVTGPLAGSVLKTAYVKMLPIAVARVMSDLSHLVSNFVSALRALDQAGSSKPVQVELLRAVFQQYVEDVRLRIERSLARNVPTESDVKDLAAEKYVPSLVFDDAYSSETSEMYFMSLAREVNTQWQDHYLKAVEECCAEVNQAHQKWQRSVDFHLTKLGLDVVTRQRVLLETQNLQMVRTASGTPLLDGKVCDAIAAEHAKKVLTTNSKQLFQRTRSSYVVTPEAVLGFLAELHKEWVQACAAEVQRRCLQPQFQNFEEVVQNIEELNTFLAVGVRVRSPSGDCSSRSPQAKSFDLSFVHELADVLPQITAFESKDTVEAIEEQEADLCNDVCDKVREVLHKLTSDGSDALSCA